jgi:hypothetical protein
MRASPFNYRTGARVAIFNSVVQGEPPLQSVEKEELACQTFIMCVRFGYRSSPHQNVLDHVSYVIRNSRTQQEHRKEARGKKHTQDTQEGGQEESNTPKTATASCCLPLCFGGQPRASPRTERDGVVPGDVHHGMVHSGFEETNSKQHWKIRDSNEVEN